MQVSISAVLRQYENPAAYGGMYCLISRAGSEEPISEPGLSTDTTCYRVFLSFSQIERHASNDVDLEWRRYIGRSDRCSGL